MQRKYDLYLKDILKSIGSIEDYTNKLGFKDFKKRKLVQDAVLRNLEVVGEAVKKIPEDVKNKKSEIEWKKIE